MQMYASRALPSDHDSSRSRCSTYSLLGSASWYSIRIEVGAAVVQKHIIIGLRTLKNSSSNTGSAAQIIVHYPTRAFTRSQSEARISRGRGGETSTCASGIPRSATNDTPV